MATIPVEKKSSVPVWVWPLAVLAVALIGWAILASREDEPEPVAVETTVVETPPTLAADADLAGAVVTRLAGPSAFFVTPPGGAGEILVYTPAGVSAAPVAVGDRLLVSGVMTPLDRTEALGWGVTETDLAALGADARYLRAARLQSLGAPAAAPDTAVRMATPDPVPSDPAGAAITRVEELGAPSLTPLVGRRVDLAEATVLSVVGDSTFVVGQGGTRVLVSLSGLGEQQQTGGAADGRFAVAAGDRVRLSGTLTAFDAAAPAFARLSPADRALASQRGAYISVTRAADVARP